MTNETKLIKIQEFSHQMGEYTYLFEQFLDANWNQHDHDMVHASYLTLRDYVKGARNFYDYLEATHPGFLESLPEEDQDGKESNNNRNIKTEDK